MSKPEPGVLYIVATPIGHLGDITTRALQVLKTVDCIAVEDTRHSQKLLHQYGIKKPLIALHEHNEREKAVKLLKSIQEGIHAALISDAGTPLISDPGYHLVHLAHQQGVRVVPIPGPCAVIAALSASGLPTDHFQFEGFLQAKSASRSKRLKRLAAETNTLVFFEAPHRIEKTLAEMVVIFGEKREGVVARELTKTFETIKAGVLEELLAWIKSDPHQQKGEFVIIVAGLRVEATNKTLTPEAKYLLQVLLTELSAKQAVSLTAKITGVRKQLLYEYSLRAARNPLTK